MCKTAPSTETMTVPSKAAQIRMNDANTRWWGAQNNEKEMKYYYYYCTLLPEATTK